MPNRICLSGKRPEGTCSREARCGGGGVKRRQRERHPQRFFRAQRKTVEGQTRASAACGERTWETRCEGAEEAKAGEDLR